MPKKYNPPWYSGKVIYSYANNNATAFNAYVQREKYRAFVFPPSRVRASFDFWGKDKYYGRLDTFGSAISPRESYLKQLRFAEGPLFALNFVADAWRDLSEKLRELVNEGVLINSGPYVEPLAVKAWSSIENQYHEYMTVDIFNTFNDVYMSLESRNKALKDVNSFLDIFYDYSEMIISQAGPLTLSAYMEGIYSSPLNTGLVIEISDENHDNDLAKAKDFIHDKNFQLVASIATQYGFSLDRNAPWRFVADINSPAMIEYMLGVSPLFRNGAIDNSATDCGDTIINDPVAGEYYGYSSIPGFENVKRHALGYPAFREVLSGGISEPQDLLQKVFSAAFRQIWTTDIDILKVYILDIYNRYVEGNPYVISYDEARRECDVKNKITIRERQQRSLFDRTTGTYGSKWNLKSYYLVRSLERRINDSIKKRTKDIQRIFTYYDFGLGGQTDYSKYINALRLIHQDMIGPPQIKGGDSSVKYEDGAPIKTLADY